MVKRRKQKEFGDYVIVKKSYTWVKSREQKDFSDYVIVKKARANKIVVKGLKVENRQKCF